MRSERVRDVIGTLARLGLAAVFLVSGVLKAVDPDATYVAVRAYDVLPRGGVTPVAGVLPWLEIALGLVLLAGVGTRAAAAVCAALLLDQSGAGLLAQNQWERSGSAGHPATSRAQLLAVITGMLPSYWKLATDERCQVDEAPSKKQIIDALRPRAFNLGCPRCGNQRFEVGRGGVRSPSMTTRGLSRLGVQAFL